MNSSPKPKLSPSAVSNSLRVTQVVVLTTAMLTFIPFWKAAAIVLCDFGSSAFYAGGIAMQAFGSSFPWYVMAVMLFSGAMIGVYIESCSMFVRGGVYRVVKEALGDSMAKISVSALMFDYVLTGPISAVSAGLYLAGFINQIFPILDIPWHVPHRFFASVFAALVTVYFWKQNIKGIEESGDKSVKIMGIVSCMGIVLLLGSVYTIWKRGAVLPGFELSFTGESLGWISNFNWQSVAGLGIIMAFGHSVLAMSGLETLAQVYREIEAPKLRNLKKTALAVFIYSLLFTGVLTFMSSLIIPMDAIKTKYADNLLAGLAMYLAVPEWFALILQAFVVFAGILVLSGAVNTAIVGSNGVLNRVAEDGILSEWFRRLHPKYGTTHRIINMIAGLQICIILICGGNVYLLGEAYAFGVIWSFMFKALAMIVLRFRDMGQREWMVPFNIKVKDVFVPAGILLILLVLISVSGVNLFTKKIATVSGISFTLVFFAMFYFSEKANKKTAGFREEETSEMLNSKLETEIASALAEITKPNRVLVAVRNPNNMHHLEKILQTADGDTTDIVVICSKVAKGIQLSGETSGLGHDEKQLFTSVVSAAEKYGHTIIPLLVLSNDPFYAIAQVARSADAGQIVMGVSGSVGAEVQLERMAMAWGALKGAESLKTPVLARVIWEGRELSFQLT